MHKRDGNEYYVAHIAGKIPGVVARLSTGSEDCGYHKADVVLEYSGKTLYIQVSKTPKSNREIEKLMNRGTYSIHTYRFKDMPLHPEEIQNDIESIILKNI